MGRERSDHVAVFTSPKTAAVLTSSKKKFEK
jgi:hypothetical protein